MTRTPIKTVTFLIKCLKVDIPVYRTFNYLEVRIPRVSIYRMSLIELITAVSEEWFSIPLTKEEVNNIAAAAAELVAKQKVAAQQQADVQKVVAALPPPAESQPPEGAHQEASGALPLNGPGLKEFVEAAVTPPSAEDKNYETSFSC